MITKKELDSYLKTINYKIFSKQDEESINKNLTKGFKMLNEAIYEAEKIILLNILHKILNNLKEIK